MFNKISSRERVEFTKNLAVMLKSGITVNEALEALAEQARSKRFRRVLDKAKADIEKGTSLAESFAKDEKTFGNIFVSVMGAGEASGTLSENLSFLADWLERNNDLKEQISAAMLYPKIVLATTFLLGGGLAIFILPRLVPLFNSLKLDLPIATRILLNFSVFIQNFWFFVIPGVIAAIIGFMFISKINIVMRFLHLVYLKAPFLGKFVMNYQLALITRLLSTLFKSGLPIVESLKITSDAATNIYYQESIKGMNTRLQKGTSLKVAMESYKNLYPNNLRNIVGVGERSGALDDSFSYMAEFYSKEIDNMTKRLPNVIEPLMLIVIGLIVGFVALSIIMPIYELTSTLGS